MSTETASVYPAGPKAIRLTADFLDLQVGMAHPQGTVLYRNKHGQYVTKETKLGERCVRHISVLQGIYEVIEQ
jgi:hypothetical protein